MNQTDNVLAAIYNLIDEHGYSPSLTEVAEVVGLSARGPVGYHIGILTTLGYISHIPGTGRTLRVTEDGLDRLRSTCGCA